MKILKNFILSILVTITIITFCNCAQAKERFVTLNFEQETNNPPVALNENEIFFAGGWDGVNHNKIYPVKKYNIKTKKLTSLNTTMLQPRSGYAAYKFNDKNILIAGGRCTDNGKNCYKTAEVYNIEQNKFTSIGNPAFSVGSSAKFYKTENGLLIIGSNSIQLFDLKVMKFHPIYQFNTESTHESLTSCDLDIDNILIWGNRYKTHPLPSQKLKFVSYIYNKKDQCIKEIPLDNVFNTDKTVIPLENYIILLRGNNTAGYLSVFCVNDKKVIKQSRLKFGTLGSSGMYLGKGKVLLAGGCLVLPDIFPGKYLERGILNIKTGKYSSTKFVKYATAECYIIPLNKNCIYISRYTYPHAWDKRKVKPLLLKY